MNPLNIWRNMAAKTRMTLIIVAGCVLITLIVCAAWTGNFGALLGLFGGKDG